MLALHLYGAAGIASFGWALSRLLLAILQKPQRKSFYEWRVEGLLFVPAAVCLLAPDR
jgi:hypothetical protein